MNIDITDLNSKQIVKILTLYPFGSLEIKYERIFWCSETTEPETRQSPGEPPRRGPPQKEDWGNRFRKMQDSLGSMIGPAQN
jgi:hypothetical protein